MAHAFTEQYICIWQAEGAVVSTNLVLFRLATLVTFSSVIDTHLMNIYWIINLLIWELILDQER